MAPVIHRASAFSGPAAPQRPRRRNPHELCEGCGHFRSEHRSGQTDCRHDDCPCRSMGWTPPPPVRSYTRSQITDEIKLQMESLLKSGMNYRKVASTVGCSVSTVRKYFPGYGENGLADVEIHRQIFKYHQNRRIEKEKLGKGRKS